MVDKKWIAAKDISLPRPEMSTGTFQVFQVDKYSAKL